MKAIVCERFGGPEVMAERDVSEAAGNPYSILLRKLATIREAAGEVNRAIFFSAAIIIASFVPLFTLVGVEGHIFGPMAKTYAYAIAGGLLATFTISPALSALLLSDGVKEGDTVVSTGQLKLHNGSPLIINKSVEPSNDPNPKPAER